MTVEGIGPCLAVEGATTRIVFETYIERVLVPGLGAGQVVVMDNLSAHKGERVRELLQSVGCELLYLSPYSPDLSPIEEAFSKVKGLLRKAQARSREALVEAMGKALEARSAPKTQEVSLSTADTALWVNCFDLCCRGALAALDEYRTRLSVLSGYRLLIQ
jgi:transposase